MGIFWKPFSFGGDSEATTEQPKQVEAVEAVEVTEQPKQVEVKPIEAVEAKPIEAVEANPIYIGTPSTQPAIGLSEADIPSMSVEEINENWDKICSILEDRKVYA